MVYLHHVSGTYMDLNVSSETICLFLFKEETTEMQTCNKLNKFFLGKTIQNVKHNIPNDNVHIYRTIIP